MREDANVTIVITLHTQVKDAAELIDGLLKAIGPLAKIEVIPE